MPPSCRSQLLLLILRADSFKKFLSVYDSCLPGKYFVHENALNFCIPVSACI